jgi:cytidine deaminase
MHRREPCTCMRCGQPLVSSPMAMALMEAEVLVLQKRAAEAAENSYSPYSRFRVGAAVLLHADERQQGEIVAGTNVENASYRLTTCAEQAAITAAVTRFGPRIRIRAVAVANLNGATCMPCGACRQTLLEFADDAAPVFYPAANGEVIATTVGDLLPAGFRLSPSSQGPVE